MTFTLFLILAATIPLWVPCVAVLGAMAVWLAASVYGAALNVIDEFA